MLVIEGRPWDPESGAWGPTAVEVWDPATGAWRTTESLNAPRGAFAAVALLDGRALVAGGLNDIGQSYSSAYVYDPRPGYETWSKVGLMDMARTAPSAAVLPDGRVLVAGGYFRDEPSSSRDAAPDTLLAAYRPASPGETVTPTPPLANVVPTPPGVALATAELFDPVTGNWSPTGSLNYARIGAAAVTLADGRVLIVGSGRDSGGVMSDPRASDSAEIYDPETEKFTLVGTLPTSRIPTLVALSDGGALLVDHGRNRQNGAINQSFRFDPQSDVWSEVGPGPVYEALDGPRYNAMVAALPDGRVLVAGGYGAYETAAELYDPTTDVWSPLPPMPEARADGAAVVLPDGSVLLVGGDGQVGSEHADLTSAIRFVPSP